MMPSDDPILSSGIAASEAQLDLSADEERRTRRLEGVARIEELGKDMSDDLEALALRAVGEPEPKTGRRAAAGINAYLK